MGLEMDVGKRRSVKMDVPSFKSNDNFADELERELMKYTYDDSKVDEPLIEPTKEACTKNANGEVDIVECKRYGANELVEDQCRDTTESSSSSFGNSESEDDTLGDEALSGFHGDAESALDFHRDMFGPRRKKLTAHWRTFIQPVMWRCKWAELQIKKLEAQARKYDKQLAEYNQQKHIQLESSASESIAVKTLPYSQKNLRNKVLRRKKRRRTETKTDLAAHMSNHNLFSYYENRKSINEAVFMDKAKNPAKAGQKVKIDENFKIDESLWASDELLWARPGDCEDHTEQMLHKIMSLESQLGKMRGRVDKVIDQNAEKFSYLESLRSLIPNTAAFIETPQNNNTTPNSGDGANIGSYVSSQFMTQQYMGDPFMTGIASTSHTNVVPDLTPSEKLARFADALKNGGDGVLAANMRVKQETNDFGAMKNWLMESPPLVIKDEPGGSSAPLMEEPDLPLEDQPPPKIRSIAKLTAPAESKGRRGRRKGAGRGDPKIVGTMKGRKCYRI